MIGLVVCGQILGCGSGASIRALLQAVEAAGLEFDIVGLDASAGMLRQSLAKQWPTSVQFEVGQAEDLAGPHGGSAIRFMVPLRRTCSAMLPTAMLLLAGLFDRLADDGVFVVQEYSIAGCRSAQLVWTLVC
jgi:trans-aconitate methyltransferase